MGAIWDFISGKSTDWDEVDAKNAEASRRAAERQAERERNRPKRIVRCYCKVCGVKTDSAGGWCEEPDWIRSLQLETSGCGEGCHVPELVWK